MNKLSIALLAIACCMQQTHSMELEISNPVTKQDVLKQFKLSKNNVPNEMLHQQITSGGVERSLELIHKSTMNAHDWKELSIYYCRGVNQNKGFEHSNEIINSFINLTSTENRTYGLMVLISIQELKKPENQEVRNQLIKALINCGVDTKTTLTYSVKDIERCSLKYSHSEFLQDHAMLITSGIDSEKAATLLTDLSSVFNV